MPVPLNIAGKSYPMTVLTPVPWYCKYWQKCVHFVFSRLKFAIVYDLRFIHFARWVLIDRKGLPNLVRGQPKEDLIDHLYFFSTNFNGPWDQYIDAFGKIPQVSRGLNILWQSSRRFPGTEQMRGFKRYIHYYEYPLDLYYNAYPEATVRDIAAAKALETRLNTFLEQSSETQSDEAFAIAYNAFLTDVSPFLSTTGARAEDLPSIFHSQPQGLQL